MNEPVAGDEGRDERQLAALIRDAGRREQPSPAAVATARAAVAAEWRQVVAARAQRRTVVRRWSLAATVALAGVATWLALPQVSPGVAVAAVERSEGRIEGGVDGWLPRWSPVADGAVLATGTALRAAPGARAALRFGDLSVRVDADSVIALVAPGRIELRQGGVYVESGREGGADLVVDTPYGSVRHLGTQYEARLDDGALRVRVREGRVQVAADGQAIEARAGEQLTLAAGSAVRREAIAPSGGEWAWTEAIAPAFDIDEHSLYEFLSWVGRQTGRELVFTNPTAEKSARELVLRGSVRGMTPGEALAAVLVTTPLQASTHNGVLRVGVRDEVQ